MLAKRLSVLVILGLMVQAAFSATYTVSKTDPDASFSSIQAAVDAAQRNDVIEITDFETYNEQVTIDSTKHFITIRSINPLSRTKPVIKWQDRANVGPTTCAEAQVSSKINFDQNGALRLMRVRGVTIDGICVDGGGAYPFAYPGIWNCKDELFHGNSAICLFVAGDAQIRNCEVRNAYFGFNVKDRNIGGVFANKNPSDLDQAVALSGFAKTGNHLFEYNKIHDNSWGFFFESTWDLGSSVRYNLIYNNYHSTATLTAISGLPGKDHQPGGAFQFKDGYLSPLAIYNNTLWNNYIIFAGHWKPGGQHLIFNNIYSSPKYYWGTGYPGTTKFTDPWHAMDAKSFIQRTKHCVYATQKEAPKSRTQGYYIQCTGGNLELGGVSQVTISNDIQDGNVAKEGKTFTVDCTDGTTTTQFVEFIKNPGALISSTTGPWPAAANMRWLETEDLFQSTDTASPNFLVPKWDDTLVAKYIKNQGWPEAGIRNSDGSMADLGAIPSSGARQPNLIRIKPLMVVNIKETTANVQFSIDQLSGSMTNPRIKYLRWIQRMPIQTNSAFGSTMVPLVATDIQTVDITGKTLKMDESNDLTFTIPSRGSDSTWQYGFFEIVVEGDGPNGQTISSDVGFLPYRKLDYIFKVEVRNAAGTKITTVRAGEPVKLFIQPIKLNNGAEVPYNEKIEPVSVSLIQAGAFLYNVSDQQDFSVSSITGAQTYDVYFTKTGTEYVKASGEAHPEPELMLSFLGLSDGIRVLPGTPEKLYFKNCPKNDAQPQPIAPGQKYSVEVQVTDKYDNPVDVQATVNIESLHPTIGDIEGVKTAKTDSAGVALFTAVVTSGTYGQIFDMEATLASNSAKALGALRVGRARDRFFIFYGDTASVSPDPDVIIEENAGVRVPVVIRAMRGDTLLTERNTQFEVTTIPGISIYSSEDAPTPQTTFSLVNGELKIWIMGTTDVEDGYLNVTPVADVSIIYNSRQGIYFHKAVSVVDYGVAYADNGFGRVDRLEVYYLQDLTDQTMPDSIVLQWPRTGDEYRKKVERLLITLDPNNPKHITVNFPDPFPEGITGFSGSGLNLGIAYHSDPLVPGQVLEPSPFNVKDSVGPIIATGQVVERLSAGHDTLIITTSEPLLDPTVLVGSSITLIKAVTDSVVQLNILGAVAYGEYYKLVLADLGDLAPQEGDQIKFNVAGSVVDNNGVGVREDNRPVTLSLRQIPPDIESAVYFDKNADGIVEGATVTFNKKVRIDEMKMSFNWSGNRADSLGVPRLSYGDDSTTVNVDFSGAFARNLTVKTDGVMQVAIKFLGFIEEKSAAVADQAAPVLVGALLKVGLLDEAGNSLMDTLDITVSENLVEPSKDGVLKQVIIAQGGTTYTPDLLYLNFHVNAGEGTYTYSYLVQNLNLATGYPAVNDSVSIEVTGQVTDVNSNVQANPANRRVPLQIKANVQITVKIGPNPYTIGNGTMVSKIDPKVKNPEQVTVTGTVEVFDNMGNVVLKTEAIRLNPASTELTWEWNGYNAKGRSVGTGTYVAFFTVDYTAGNSTGHEVIKRKLFVIK